MWLRIVCLERFSRSLISLSLEPSQISDNICSSRSVRSFSEAEGDAPREFCRSPASRSTTVRLNQEVSVMTLSMASINSFSDLRRSVTSCIAQMTQSWSLISARSAETMHSAVPSSARFMRMASLRIGILSFSRFSMSRRAGTSSHSRNSLAVLPTTSASLRPHSVRNASLTSVSTKSSSLEIAAGTGERRKDLKKRSSL